MNFIEFEHIRSGRQWLLILLVVFALFNHFIRTIGSRTSYFQPSIQDGGKIYSPNQTISALDNFRVKMGERLQRGSTYCPEKAAPTCNVILGAVRVIFGIH